MTVFDEINYERQRQIDKWGGAEHDDKHTPDDWAHFIDVRNIPEDEKNYRKNLIQIAALAVAAVESHDRLTAKELMQSSDDKELTKINPNKLIELSNEELLNNCINEENKTFNVEVYVKTLEYLPEPRKEQFKQYVVSRGFYPLPEYFVKNPCVDITPRTMSIDDLVAKCWKDDVFDCWEFANILSTLRYDVQFAFNRAISKKLDEKEPKQLKFKVNPGSYLPTKANPTDAAFDVFLNSDIIILPKRIYKVPLGIYWEGISGYFAKFYEKSGLALKGLEVKAGVIDAAYRDEWCAVVYNDGLDSISLSKGKAIAQFCIHKVENIEVVQSDTLSVSLNRGGGFGSSGK